MEIENGLIKIDSKTEASYFLGMRLRDKDGQIYDYCFNTISHDGFIISDIISKSIYITPADLWDMIKPIEGKAYIKFNDSIWSLRRQYKESIDYESGCYFLKANELTINKSNEYLKELWDLCHKEGRE